MPIRYKIDVLETLKSAGWSTYRLRKEKKLGEKTIQQLRTGEPTTMDSLGKICGLTGLQPGDILEYIKDEE